MKYRNIIIFIFIGSILPSTTLFSPKQDEKEPPKVLTHRYSYDSDIELTGKVSLPKFDAKESTPEKEPKLEIGVNVVSSQVVNDSSNNKGQVGDSGDAGVSNKKLAKRSKQISTVKCNASVCTNPSDVVIRGKNHQKHPPVGYKYPPNKAGQKQIKVSVPEISSKNNHLLKKLATTGKPSKDNHKKTPTIFQVYAPERSRKLHDDIGYKGDSNGVLPSLKMVKIKAQRSKPTSSGRNVGLKENRNTSAKDVSRDLPEPFLKIVGLKIMNEKRKPTTPAMHKKKQNTKDNNKNTKQTPTHNMPLSHIGSNRPKTLNHNKIHTTLHVTDKTEHTSQPSHKPHTHEIRTEKTTSSHPTVFDTSHKHVVNSFLQTLMEENGAHLNTLTHHLLDKTKNVTTELLRLFLSHNSTIAPKKHFGYRNSNVSTDRTRQVRNHTNANYLLSLLMHILSPYGTSNVSPHGTTSNVTRNTGELFGKHPAMVNGIMKRILQDVEASERRKVQHPHPHKKANIIHRRPFHHRTGIVHSKVIIDRHGLPLGRVYHYVAPNHKFNKGPFGHANRQLSHPTLNRTHAISPPIPRRPLYLDRFWPRGPRPTNWWRNAYFQQRRQLQALKNRFAHEPRRPFEPRHPFPLLPPAALRREPQHPFPLLPPVALHREPHSQFPLLPLVAMRHEPHHPLLPPIALRRHRRAPIATTVKPANAPTAAVKPASPAAAAGKPAAKPAPAAAKPNATVAPVKPGVATPAKATAASIKNGTTAVNPKAKTNGTVGKVQPASPSANMTLKGVPQIWHGQILTLSTILSIAAGVVIICCALAALVTCLCLWKYPSLGFGASHKPGLSSASQERMKLIGPVGSCYHARLEGIDTQPTISMHDLAQKVEAVRVRDADETCVGDCYCPTYCENKEPPYVIRADQISNPDRDREKYRAGDSHHSRLDRDYDTFPEYSAATRRVTTVTGPVAGPVSMERSIRSGSVAQSQSMSHPGRGASIASGSMAHNAGGSMAQNTSASMPRTAGAGGSVLHSAPLSQRMVPVHDKPNMR